MHVVRRQARAPVMCGPASFDTASFLWQLASPLPITHAARALHETLLGPLCAAPFLLWSRALHRPQ